MLGFFLGMKLTQNAVSKISQSEQLHVHRLHKLTIYA